MDTNDGMWQDNLIVFGEIYYRNNVFWGIYDGILIFLIMWKHIFMHIGHILYQGSSNLDHSYRV